jgi:CMP-N-acetylneuraminic acid synthetase
MDLTMVSLIPARGGSERIPRKNIKLLAGKPMLAWTIEASLKSKYISRTFVSTEDPEIKEISLKYGAEVIDRPLKYATDKGYELLGVFQQFKEFLWDVKPDYLCFLYPTSPLRTSEQIDKAYELMIANNCTRCYTAYQINAGIYEECWTISQTGKANHLFEESQENMHLKNIGFNYEVPKYVHTGEVVIMRFRNALPYTDMDYGNLSLYVIDKYDVIDVNEESDFEMAEMILKKRLREVNGNENRII